MAYEDEPPTALELFFTPFLLLLLLVVLAVYAPFWAIDRLRAWLRERKKEQSRFKAS